MSDAAIENEVKGPNPARGTKRIGLALSGGGVRAATYHMGMLKRLASEGLLEQVTVISSVSGGSLVTAAVVAAAGMRWPSSSEFLDEIYPAVREKMTNADLFSLKAIGWRGISEFNIDLVKNRATVLARLLERNWGISGTLDDLPDVPHWLINATCIETGKNWRFAKREMGDWSFGRHLAPQVPLSVAAAASAAVPYVIGAMPLDVPRAGWWEPDPATGGQVRAKTPTVSKVRLWDGGAYDNMGLEAVTKPGKGLRHCDFLICSDASGPLPVPGGSPLSGLLRGRLSSPRLFDVAGDQIRALRSRVLIADIAAGKLEGVLLRMGNSVRAVDIKSGLSRQVGFYDCFQTDEEAATALQHPTDLKALSKGGFDALARHGFEVADITLTTYAPAGFPRSFHWENQP